MKKYRIIITLLVFICFSSAGFCQSLSTQGQFSPKLKLQNARDISKRANYEQSYSSEPSIDPITKSQITGIGNAIQGMTGNMGNIYSIQDQIRQNNEYTTQNLKED